MVPVTVTVIVTQRDTLPMIVTAPSHNVTPPMIVTAPSHAVLYRPSSFFTVNNRPQLQYF